MITRRQLLSKTLSLSPLLFSGKIRAQGASATQNSAAPNQRLQSFSIIHTTDLHGHILPSTNYDGIQNIGGLARCASQIRQWRRAQPNHLLLDIGDLYQGTEVSKHSEGEIMIELLNQLNYHAWTIGNHEFDWGHETLQTISNRGNMPTLSANLQLDSSEQGAQGWDRLLPHFVHQFGDIKVGIFGLCTPGLPNWLPPELRGPFEVLDPAPVAQAQITHLREDQGCHVVICCAHMGLRGYAGSADNHANRIQALFDLDGLDLVLGGHTHQDFTSVVRHGTHYSQAGYWGNLLGKVDITYDHQEQRVYSVRSQSKLMDHSTELDAGILAHCQNRLRSSENRLDQVIGTLATPLSSRYNRHQPNGHQRLIAEAVAQRLERAEQPVDAVYHGDFAKGDEPAGEKTLADIWRLIPYENAIVTVQLSAGELIPILNEGIEHQRSLIGLGIIFDEDQQAISLTDSQANPIAPEQQLTIALNAYDAQSGGTRLPLLAAAVANPNNQRHYHNLQTREAIIELFAEESPLALPEPQD